MFRNCLLAGAALCALNSCASAPTRVLTAADLLATPFSVSAAAPFDAEAFFGAFPDWMSSSYANASFDSATGAMVVDQLTLSFDALPGAAIEIAQASIWTPDIAAMDAVYSGAADYIAMSQLVDRVQMTGVSLTGLQNNQGAQSAAFNIDKLVLDGVAARSFAIPENSQAPSEVQPVRWIAAVLNSYNFDGAAYAGLSFRMNDNQGNAVSMAVGEAFMRDYRRGAIDYQTVSGILYETSTLGVVENSGPTDVAFRPADMIANETASERFGKILQPEFRKTLKSALENPVAVLAQAYGGMNGAQSVESIEWAGYDISRILPYIVEWRMPPITDTDILSLGAGAAINSVQSLNGSPVYSNARSDIDMSEFYWLVPSRIVASENGSMIDVGAIMDIFQAQGVNTPEFNQSRQMLADLDLEKIRYDSSFGWAWDGDNGNATLQSDTQIVNFADLGFGVDVAGPNLAGWKALADSPENHQPADQLSLGGFGLALRDHGALDKVFAIAAAQAGGAPDDLRAAMPPMIRMSGAQAAEMNPRFADYAEALANFVANGGEISISAAPAAPVKFSALQQMLNSSPETFPDTLDLAITHRP